LRGAFLFVERRWGNMKKARKNKKTTKKGKK